MNTNTTYYGFPNANTSDEPAWFCTAEAAQRFADACGWENASIETCEEAESSEIMDTPDLPFLQPTRRAATE